MKFLDTLLNRREKGLDLSNATRSDIIMLSRLAGKKERTFIENRLRVPIHRFTDFSSYMETGNKRVWATFRSCKLISSVMVSAEFSIVREGDDTPVELRDSDPDTIRFSKGGFLDRPNPYDSWEELVEMTAFHLELVGNAYWLKDEIDLLGRPTALYPLLPQHIRIIPGRTEKVLKYIYHVNGEELELKPSEVIHFKQVNPGNLNLGMGSIEPAQSLYQQFINKGTLEEKFVENGAQISGVLTREDGDITDEKEWAKFKKKFNLEYTGKKNAGKVAFLNGKWSYHKLGMSMEEMQALEREKWTVQQIFLNHGVPLSVAGIEGAANYATARQDERNFRRYKVVPMLDLIVGKLNAEGFIQANGKELRLTYALSGLIDVEQIVKDYGKLVELGAMTRNELREMCGLEPVEDNPYLDQFMVSKNIVPIELSGVSNPSDPALDGEEDPDDPNVDPDEDPEDPNDNPDPEKPPKEDPKKPDPKKPDPKKPPKKSRRSILVTSGKRGKTSIAPPPRSTLQTAFRVRTRARAA